ncbi:MAG: glycosyltransferase, partial [Leucobacter sp.]
MELTVIVPTFNEGPNIAELVIRLEAACVDIDCEAIFVDDSTDDTPDIVDAVAKTSRIPVRLIHRERPEGGLGGAVIAGLRAARADTCLVMDGDLQHPPEDIPRIYQRFMQGDVDVVVASRYTGEGTAHGLANALRTGVSRTSTLVTR